MITIRETTAADLSSIQALWADGDVMQFVGFPQGLHESDERMANWFARLSSARPTKNHYCIFEDGVYCGETFYSIDVSHGHSAAMDIKLFSFARGRGIATKALDFAIQEAFKNGAKKVWVDPNPDNKKAIALYERLGFERKPFPDYLKGDYDIPSVYMERPAK